MKEEQIEKAARDLCTTDRQEQWLKDFGMACFADAHDGALRPSGTTWKRKCHKYMETMGIQFIRKYHAS